MANEWAGEEVVADEGAQDARTMSIMLFLRWTFPISLSVHSSVGSTVLVAMQISR